MKKYVLLALSGLTAFVTQAAAPFTVFQADFEGSALINDTVTPANLNAGTVVGSWTVADDQESDIRSGSGNAALLADTGTYRFEANFSETAILTNNGVILSLDTYMRRTGDASVSEANLKPQKIVGLDSRGYELFDIRITAGLSHVNAMRVGFVDALGTERYLGNSGDVTTYSVDTPNSAKFQTLELTLHETTMDISYDGGVLTNGIAYRNSGMTHISGIRLAGVENNTGAFYDNISATATTVSENEEWPREGFIPHTTSGDNLIHVTTADFDGVGVKDHIVGMSTDGKVIAYPRPEMILNAATDQRLWEFDGGPTMGYTLQAADAIPSSPGEEVLLPGTDGHLRILSANGQLLADWPVSSGALTCAAAGTNSTGETRILTGGVDGILYAFEPNGTSAGSFLVAGSMTSFLTHVVVGNFDGQGGDEIMVFYSIARLNQKLDCFDFDALDGSRPLFWEATSSLQNNLHELAYLRTFPFAYDMDGDGKDEVVGPWGILRPEEAWEGVGVIGSLQDLVNPDELLAVNDYNKKPHPATLSYYSSTLGVPGRFQINQAASIAFVYGDDFYLAGHDVTNRALAVTDHTYAPPGYDFTGAARLENRNGAPDRLVLAGPITGDDHFYVVNLADDSWKEDAKYIDGRGKSGEIAATYENMTEALDQFQGTVASPAPEMVYFRCAMGGWLEPNGDMTQQQIESYADAVAQNMQTWYDIIGGSENYQPQRFRLICMGVIQDPGVSAPIEDHLAICRAFAERGIHFSMQWNRWKCREPGIYPPSMLADLFEASVTNGISYLHVLSGEFDVEWLVTENFLPYFDALQERALTLGIEPPDYLLDVKGPQWHKMSPEAWSNVFPKYSNLIVPSVENSNQRGPELSFSERVGMWLKGDVDHWASRTIGDNFAATRAIEWTGMNNAHMVFRQMLSQYAFGARDFSIDSVTGTINPLYEDGTISDPEQEWVPTYRDGLFSFLKIIERGVYPANPEPQQLLGIAPVALAVNQPNDQRLARVPNYTLYVPNTAPYAIGQLHYWDAYTDVDSTDATAFLFNTRRRWENLLPTSPCGFIPTLPYTSQQEAEAFPWCDGALETDLDGWTEFGDLAIARDTISADLMAQRTNMLFYVDGECFWQVTEERNDPHTLFAVVMDSSEFTPVARAVGLMKGVADGIWDVYDQLGSSSTPLGTLATETDSISIAIPAGSVRLLALKKRLPISTTVMGIAWDGATAPALAINGLDGAIIPSSQGIRLDANSTDGYFGPDGGYGGASTATYGAYQVKDYNGEPGAGWISVAITNNTEYTLQLETLCFDYGQWYAESPTNVTVLYRSGDLSSVSNETTLANFSALTLTGWIRGDYDDFEVALTNLTDSSLASGEHAVFELRTTTGTTAAGGFDNVAIAVSGLANYDAWIAGFGLYGSNVLASADLEPDGLNNWMEYILGGDPTLDDAAAILPTFGMVPEEGTNWLEYVYRRRNDYQVRGLVYTVEATTNLVSNGWNSSGVVDAGFGTLNAEMDSVTNRVSTDELPAQFIRLRVE